MSRAVASVAPPAPLPAAYRILPHVIPFWIPGFEKHRVPGALTLAPEPVDCGAWFNGFADRVLGAIARGEHFPVMRMSDGEFIFLLGPQPFSRRLPAMRRLAGRAKQLVSIWMRDGGGFSGATAPGVPVGRYTRGEVRQGREVYARVVPQVARTGVLAPHLNWEHVPFQEHFFPAFGRWLQEHHVALTRENHVPFYFVYALLSGPRRREVLGGRSVLVVHGASGPKRERIQTALEREGVRRVIWCAISPERSLHDRIEPGRWAGEVDLCLVGGGVGKVNLLEQLSVLPVPCLDAGYLFEAWADPERRWHRSYLVPDEDMEFSRAFPYAEPLRSLWLRAHGQEPANVSAQ